MHKLKRYSFDKEYENLAKYIQALDNSILDVSEIPMSNKRIEQLERIIQNVTDFGKELNLDLSDRKLDIKKIHFLDSKEFAGFLKAYEIPPLGMGTNLPDNNIVIYEQESDLSLAIAQHEVIHAMSHREFRINSSVEEIGQGFWNTLNNDFNHINEAFTETINQYIISKYWSKDFAKKEELKVAYRKPQIWLDNRMTELSEGIPYFNNSDDVFKFLATGYFVGDEKVLDIFKLYGEEPFEMIKKNLVYFT